MIFHRAFRREFTYTATGVFIALFAILLTVVLIRLLGQAAGGRVPADAVLALISFGALTQLPVVLSLTAFVSVLMVLSRSYRDSEMVVWFASGQPLTAFIRPVLQFAIPVIIVIGALSVQIAPWAYSRSEAYQAQLDARDDTTRIAPGIFRESGDGNRVLFVEDTAEEDGKLRNVFVGAVQDGKLGIDIIASSLGSTFVDKNGDRFVVLENGRRYEGLPGAAEYRVQEFERYTVLVETRKPLDPTVRARTRSVRELIEIPVPRHLGELSERISMPVMAFMLVLMAIPLSFVNPRVGRGYNMIFAILLYLIYSNSISITQSWISQERLAFSVGVFLPHLLVLTLLLLMFYHRLAISPFWRRRAAS